MSSNICKRLLIQIFPKLIVGVVCLWCGVCVKTALGVGCGAGLGSSRVDSDQWGNNLYLHRVDETASGDGRFYRNPSGSNRCDGVSNTLWCRMSAAGNGDAYAGPHVYASKCSSNCYHLERARCATDQTYTQYVDFLTGNSRSCRDGFFFGPVVNSVDWDGGSASNTSITLLGATLGFADIIGTSTFSVVEAGKSEYFYTYAWDTSNCQFSVPGTYSYSNCQVGTFKWKATSTSHGDAQSGFYVFFYRPDATYTCSQCKIGYKSVNGGVYKYTSNSNSSIQAGCTCNTEYHWDCTQTPAHCIRGYYISSTECSYYPTDYFDCDESGCKCRSGFVVNNQNSYMATCGPDCKTNFRPDGEGHCICDENMGYTWVRDNDNPENDTCVLNTSQVYVDQTGWFTLSSDGLDVCRDDWWVQENNN